MSNTRLASRYAKSLLDLSIENNKLELIYADMQYIIALEKASKEFAAVMASPIIKAEKKIAILNAVTKGNIDVLSARFITLLINKGREDSFAEIAQAFIEQYNSIKGIRYVNLTTAVPVSDEIKNLIKQKVEQETNLTGVYLNAKVDEKLLGGFIVEYNNTLLDLSLAGELQKIRRAFKENLFEANLR
jgi:F-type H+-transporting ATPase subunit delta